MNITRRAARLNSAEDVRVQVEGVVCDACTDTCWTVEVWALGLLGSDARACLLYREHLRTMSEGFTVAGQWMLASARELRDAEAAVWFLEHQPRLW